MPRRRSTIKSPDTLTEPSTAKLAAPSESPPPQDLQGWIRHFESEFLKRAALPGTKAPRWAVRTLHGIRKRAKDSETDCWLSPDRQEIERIAGHLPMESTFHEALKDRLLILWADEELWMLIRKGQVNTPPPPHTTDDYVKAWLAHKYRLQFPFAPSVWLEMVRQPVQRAILFDVLLLSAPRFFWSSRLTPRKIFNPSGAVNYPAKC